MKNPILNPRQKQHRQGDFDHSEVSLANRNNGTLLETLHHDTTPIGAHYLLNHFDVPYVDNQEDWQITIDGNVANPISKSLSEIIQQAEQKKLTRTQRVTLECAGNGRANLLPRWPSQPWQIEAVGTADWHGFPLKHLLADASPASRAKEVVFYGADHGIDAGIIHHFARSLSMANAMHDDVMLVWQMNAQPLLPQHGFPVRLIVPGWYGMASVKWINNIKIIDHHFTGHQQTGTYVYRKDHADIGTPVTFMRVKSVLIPPGIPDWSSRKRLVKPGDVQLVGRAWSGNGVPIVKVEWSCNGSTGGNHWQATSIEQPKSKYAWSKWTASWNATAGKHILSCRATDAEGNTQPVTPPWDIAGFGNNATHNIEVWCEDY